MNLSRVINAANISMVAIIAIVTKAMILVSMASGIAIYPGSASYGQERSDSSDAASLARALDAYKHGRYTIALTELDTAPISTPTVRYYRALCYQGANQLERAQQEYFWLYKNSADPDIRYKSWRGLQIVANYKQNRRHSSHASIEATRRASSSGRTSGAITAGPSGQSDLSDLGSSDWTMPGAGYGATGGATWSQTFNRGAPGCSK